MFYGVPEFPQQDQYQYLINFPKHRLFQRLEKGLGLSSIGLQLLVMETGWKRDTSNILKCPKSMQIQHMDPYGTSMIFHDHLGDLGKTHGHPPTPCSLNRFDSSFKSTPHSAFLCRSFRDAQWKIFKASLIECLCPHPRLSLDSCMRFQHVASSFAGEKGRKVDQIVDQIELHRAVRLHFVHQMVGPNLASASSRAMPCYRSCWHTWMLDIWGHQMAESQWH